MNIGIFGNTNNYPYLLASGLRNLGVTVRLIVDSSERLNRPESKEPGLASGYPDWIVDASDIPQEDFVALTPRIGHVLNALAVTMNAVILNGIGPSLYRLLERPGLAMMTGSDVTYHADFQSGAVRRTGWDPEFTRSPQGRLTERTWNAFVNRQRDGLVACEAVNFAPPGVIPDGDRLLEEIGVSHSRRMFLYMADTHHLTAQPARRNNSLRVLNGARLSWVKPMPAGFSTQDAKATDVLLHGFAQFLKEGGKGELRLIAKGVHIEETRQLIQDLKLAPDVVWLDEMSLADFHREMARADVVCDQLGTSFPGMVGLDAMAMGRPVIANFRPEILGAYGDASWPVYSVVSPSGVRDALLDLYRFPDRRVSLGADARAFAERYLSPEAGAAKCLERLGPAAHRG